MSGATASSPCAPPPRTAGSSSSTFGLAGDGGASLVVRGTADLDAPAYDIAGELATGRSDRLALMLGVAPARRSPGSCRCRCAVACRATPRPPASRPSLQAGAVTGKLHGSLGGPFDPRSARPCRRADACRSGRRPRRVRLARSPLAAGIGAHRRDIRADARPGAAGHRGDRPGRRDEIRARLNLDSSAPLRHDAGARRVDTRHGEAGAGLRASWRHPWACRPGGPGNGLEPGRSSR